MHDLIHDLAQSIVGSEVLVLRNDVSNISREARHISLSFKDVTPIMKAIMEKKGYGGKTHMVFFESLSRCFERYYNFKFISSKCYVFTCFKILPNSISRLKNLQTLKLQKCWKLKKFPKNMRELINLRHLENDDCRSLTHMQHGMGKLTSLQSLPLFVVGNGIGRLRNQKVGSLSELESLHQLRGSFCIKSLQNARDVKLEPMRKILEKKKKTLSP